MARILGTIASSSFEALGDFESIATTTVGSGGSSTITFSSIPQTFKHLQIRAIGRGNTNDSIDDIVWRYNSDSSTNYRMHYLLGDGSGRYAGTGGALNYAFTMRVANNNSPANAFGSGVLDILDYTNTNKYKVSRSLSGAENNGSGQIMFSSSVWFSTAAINSITLFSSNASSFRQYSRFALYGIKGAA